MRSIRSSKEARSYLTPLSLIIRAMRIRKFTYYKRANSELKKLGRDIANL